MHDGSPRADDLPRIGLYHPYPHRMGGSQLVTLLLAEHLCAFGYLPIIICPHAGAFVDAARSRGVVVIISEPGPLWQASGRSAVGVRGWASAAHLRQLLSYWLKLRRLLRCERIRIVHCNDVRAVVMAAPAARLAGLPAIWHLHSPPARGKRAGLDALMAACTHWRVFVSQAMHAEWRLPRWMLGKHAVIPNGIACSERAAALPRSAVPLIVAVGTLHPRKGFDVLIRAMLALRKHISTIALWIVGRDSTDGSYERYLRSLVDDLALNGHVQFLGQRHDVAQIMATADVVAVPSISEPFGMVALEAMMQAKPVVASRTGGLPSIVSDGQTGVLVPPGDAENLARALAYVLTDSTSAAAMGRAGLERAREHFSARTMAQRFAVLYAQVLSTRGRDSGSASDSDRNSAQPDRAPR